MNVYNTTSGNLTSTLTINPGDRVGIDDTLGDRLTTYNPTTGLFSGYALPDGTLVFSSTLRNRFRSNLD